MTLTPEQKRLVRSSWALVGPIQVEAARLFYGRLFETDPSTRPLFAHSDMDRQGRMLMQTINIAVSSLDRLEQIRPAIEDLGRRHAGYGVTDAHYASVGGALLWTLGQGLGEAFTPEAEQAWAETYRTLASVMQAAAAEETEDGASTAASRRLAS
jgi:hemoglobin-like flavoprotein